MLSFSELHDLKLPADSRPVSPADAPDGRKPYASPEIVIHRHHSPVLPLMASNAHIGDGFDQNDDISGGNTSGDGFVGEDIGTGGGGNPGGGFDGEDIIWGVPARSNSMFNDHAD
ncbi:MAG: hypothetical protein J6I60_06605 [Bacteroidaceae bacterium]|nr:hypothetical protein [Bacteroidaceae bacterium]